MQIESKKLRTGLEEAHSFANSRRYVAALNVTSGLLREISHDDDPKVLWAKLEKLHSELIARRKTLLIRVWTLSLFLLSAAVVSFMYFTTVSTTEVIAELKTNGLYLMLKEDGVLASGTMEAIILNNIDLLETYTGEIILENSGKTVHPDPNSPTTIRSDGTPIRATVSGEDLALASYDVYAGIPLEFHTTSGSAPTITIRQASETTAGRLDSGELVYVHCPGCGLYQNGRLLAVSTSRVIIRPESQELEFSANKAASDLALVFSGDLDSQGPDIDVGVLLVSTIDFTTSLGGPPMSFLEQGTVNIPELDEQPLTLTRGEFLVLKGLRDGYITNLSLKAPIQMRFQGQVESVSTGSGRHLFERTPSRLEWFVKNEPLGLFIAAISTVFTFLIGILVKLSTLSKV